MIVRYTNSNLYYKRAQPRRQRSSVSTKCVKITLKNILIRIKEIPSYYLTLHELTGRKLPYGISPTAQIVIMRIYKLSLRLHMYWISPSQTKPEDAYIVILILTGTSKQSKKVSTLSQFHVHNIGKSSVK